MKIKKFGLLLFLAAFFFNFSLTAACCESNHFKESINFKKTYVTPEQLHIIPEGIFFTNQEGVLENATGVFSDNYGIYVLGQYYRCPACGVMNKNNICWNSRCPLFDF